MGCEKMIKIIMFSLIVVLSLTFHITADASDGGLDGPSFDREAEITNLLGANGTLSVFNSFWDHWPMVDVSFINNILESGGYLNPITVRFQNYIKSDEFITLNKDHKYYLSYSLLRKDSADLDAGFSLHNVAVNDTLTHYDSFVADQNEWQVISGVIDFTESDKYSSYSDTDIYQIILYGIDEYGINHSVCAQYRNVLLLDLTQIFGAGNEPLGDQVELMMKVDYFENSMIAKDVFEYRYHDSMDLFVYNFPDIINDFSIENIIRAVFWIPLFMTFFLLIPFLDFMFEDTVVSNLTLGFSIVSIVVGGITSYISPNFRLWGRNSYLRRKN